MGGCPAGWAGASSTVHMVALSEVLLAVAPAPVTSHRPRGCGVGQQRRDPSPPDPKEVCRTAWPAGAAQEVVAADLSDQ